MRVHAFMLKCREERESEGEGGGGGGGGGGGYMSVRAMRISRKK